MSKHDHDVYSASERVYKSDKEWFLNGMALLKELKGDSAALQAMDIGCGNGEWADHISREFPGSSVHGVDYAEPHLEVMRSKGYQTTRLDLDNSEEVTAFTEANRAQYDLVTMFEVIEHIFDVDALLHTIHSVLKPGGRLIISTPNVAYISYRIYSMCRGNLPPSEGHHVRFFDQRRLEQLCWINGFTPEKSAPFGQGNFYLDRAADPKHQRLKTRFLDFSFKLVHLLCKKKPGLVTSGLLLAVSKSEAFPLGLDPTNRREAIERMSPEELKQAVDRLRPLLETGFFSEHPSFSEFLSQA